MNKYLIFRTDRIGDFLLTAIIINSIKRNDPNSFIRVLASKKNFDYIKSFENVDDVVLNDKTFLKQLSVLSILRKDSYSALIIHDNKKRSKILSFFIKSILKIKNNPKSTETHILKVKDIIQKLNLDFEEKDLDLFKNRLTTKLKTLPKDYIVFHFDEKWIHNSYIDHYQKIEPTEDELLKFLNRLSQKTNMDVVITTGNKTPIILRKIIENNNFENIFFLENQSFLEVESTINNCKLLISCHGAVSHIAAGSNIRQIDIIDTSYDYSLWSSHFRKYECLNRSKFYDLTNNILNLLDS